MAGLILRDFDRNIEAIATDWAGRPFADPDDFINEQGQTLKQVMAQFPAETGNESNWDTRLGWFTYQDQFQAHGKCRVTIGGKFVSDICYLAGLPVCPEILVKCKDEEDYDRVVTMSLDPFHPSQPFYLGDQPVIASVATVIDSCFGHGSRKAGDCCTPQGCGAGQMGKIALFDFEQALLPDLSDFEKGSFTWPDGMKKDQLDPAGGFEAVKRLVQIPADQIIEIITRAPIWYDSFNGYEGSVESVLNNHRRLPEVFDNLFGTAALADLQEPEKNYRKAVDRARSLQK